MLRNKVPPPHEEEVKVEEKEEVKVEVEARMEHKLNITNKNIKETVNRLKVLIQNDEYKVHHKWLCNCRNKWGKIFHPTEFRNYLTEERHPHFYDRCRKCNKRCLVSSIRLYRQEKQNSNSITEIVKHLINDSNKFKVYGNWLCRQWRCQHEPRQCLNEKSCRDKWHYQNKWQCQHEPKCQYRVQCWDKQCICQNKSQHRWYCREKWLRKQYEWNCNHEEKCKDERECQYEIQCRHTWRSAEYTQEQLLKYLEKTPKEQDEFFKQQCVKCNDMSVIASFYLYMQQPENLDEEPDAEIICHLVCNEYYRVFGIWKCYNKNCKRNKFCSNWLSSFTYISLQKFIEGTGKEEIYNPYLEKLLCGLNYKDEKINSMNWRLINGLKENDFWAEECNSCENSCKILAYKALTQGRSQPHRRDLCKKCKHYEICTQTGTYFGYKQN